MRVRFLTAQNPCPICGGFDRQQRGKGLRCSGYIDGDFVCCTREEHAGRLPQNGGGAYAHKRQGPCGCGKQHGAEVRSISESPRARAIEHYAYRGLDGEVVYEAVRFEPKGFRQRRLVGDEWVWNLHGVAPLLYRLPEVVAAVAAGDPVWIAEGERDVHALELAGLCATTNSAGAGKFPADMAQHLAGAHVTIVQDKDEAGRKHAWDVAQKLSGIAASLRIVEAKTGKDARDHLESGLLTSDFVPVWPLEDLRKADPAEWKRKLLRESLTVAESFNEVPDLLVREAEDAAPTWPSGIRGYCEVQSFDGFTVITGGPGAAKSYLALASSLSAALYGDWDVHYLSSEMPAGIIAGRVRRYLQGLPIPETWKLTEVGLGASVTGLIEHLCKRVTARKTLIVFDSISSFVDQGMATTNTRDPMGIGELKMLCIWIMNARRLTKGQVSFLVLSEANAQGGTKYRFADHKADTVLCMNKDEYDPKGTKHIEVVKGWSAIPIGTKATCALDWNTSTLTARVIDREAPEDVN